MSTRRASYADLEALPEHVVGELIDGELHVSPRPAPKHARASSGVGAFLSHCFDYGFSGPGGWWILDEPELHLATDVLVPDMAGWRVEQMPELPQVAHFKNAPDWICEVLSPSTERIDRLKKLSIYARHGVEHVWLLHPVRRTLEVFRREGETWRLLKTFDANDESVRVEPFDAVDLPLARLLGPPANPSEPAPTEPTPT